MAKAPTVKECDVCLHLYTGVRRHCPKPPKIKIPKEQKSEAELVRQYANTIISKSKTRGHKGAEVKTSKDIAMDFQFYFSVVFQSREQKAQFLQFLFDNYGIKVEAFLPNIQIVNGLKLSQSMGLDVKPEVTEDYHTGSAELADLIL